ncbi:MAG: preprotein translocase subunit YajC [Actinobacteria bacterium]|nr:preprotein translocase subunit YajC [Actinomycetota bacterium]
MWRGPSTSWQKCASPSRTELFLASGPQFWIFGASSSGSVALSGLGFTTVNAILLAAESNSNSPVGIIVVYAVLFAGMYFVIIRPRSRRNKQAAALVASTAVGDEVVLTSGIYGFVSAVEDDILWVDIADGHGTERIEVRVSRSAVARKIVSAGEADDSAKK